VTSRILQTLIIILLAYQALVGIPYTLIRDDCFNPKYFHYPQWFRFEDEYMDALAEATQPEARIGCFRRPKGDRAGALWNERWDNEVVLLDEDFWAHCIEGRVIPPMEFEYLYLREDLDAEIIEWCGAGPELELMWAGPWGQIWKKTE